MKNFSILNAMIVTLTFTAVATAQGLNVSGGSIDAPVDITAQVIENLDINLVGGHYVIRIPPLGTAGVVTTNVVRAEVRRLQTDGENHDLTNRGAGHFIHVDAPALLYTGVISGKGALRITNQSNAASVRGRGDLFKGGVLTIIKEQTFRNGAEVGLIIEPNTAVYFDVGGRISRNDSPEKIHVQNDGYLYSWNTCSRECEATWGNINSTVAGAGVVTFESGNRLGGTKYTGRVFVLNGSHILPDANFPDNSLVLLQSNIVTFQTQGGKEYFPASFGDDPAPVPSNEKRYYGGNYFSFGVDTQLTGRGGFQVFNGVAVPSFGSDKLDQLSWEEARKTTYFTDVRSGRGHSFYIMNTMQMGDGEVIVNNLDGTNNTFLQTNLEGTGANSFTNGIQVGHFKSWASRREELRQYHTMAFNYSGKYTYNAGLATFIDGSGKITGRPAPGNLVVLNPDTENKGRAANHLVLTVPMFNSGITHIYKNAILQLGDGTQGIKEQRTVAVSGMPSRTGSFSNSYGNGMVLTPLNTPKSWLSATPPANMAEFNVINNNGRLIVNNTPGALTIVDGDAVTAAWAEGNKLDSIRGTGSVEQVGSLALTLDGVNTYTGGTMIRSGATLLVASVTALGARLPDLKDKPRKGGDVVNNGMLKATAQNRIIKISGNYVQAPSDLADSGN